MSDEPTLVAEPCPNCGQPMAVVPRWKEPDGLPERPGDRRVWMGLWSCPVHGVPRDAIGRPHPPDPRKVR